MKGRRKTCRSTGRAVTGRTCRRRAGDRSAAARRRLPRSPASRRSSRSRSAAGRSSTSDRRRTGRPSVLNLPVTRAAAAVQPHQPQGEPHGARSRSSSRQQRSPASSASRSATIRYYPGRVGVRAAACRGSAVPSRCTTSAAAIVQTAVRHDNRPHQPDGQRRRPSQASTAT